MLPVWFNSSLDLHGSRFSSFSMKCAYVVCYEGSLIAQSTKKAIFSVVVVNRIATMIVSNPSVRFIEGIGEYRAFVFTIYVNYLPSGSSSTGYSGARTRVLKAIPAGMPSGCVISTVSLPDEMPPVVGLDRRLLGPQKVASTS